MRAFAHNLKNESPRSLIILSGLVSSEFSRKVSRVSLENLSRCVRFRLFSLTKYIFVYHSMEYRCLTSDGVELERWAALCALCFAEKPRPPAVSYFLNHVTNDSLSSRTDIFVAIDPSNDRQFVSSVRVFHRQIIALLSSTTVFGIGEVCTLKEYRRRGISEALLRYVIDKMTDHDNPQQYCFILHAAEWVRPLYRKFGFHGSKLEWTKISCPKVLPGSNGLSCQMVPIVDHVEQLCALSNNFNQQYHGPLHRSPDYVRKWIANEANEEGSVMVLIQQQQLLQKTNSNDMITHEEKFLAYVCLKEYPKGEFQLRDFGAHDSLSLPQFQFLLHEALNAMIPLDAAHHSTVNDTVIHDVSVPLPVAQKYVLEKLCSATASIDDGWMWMQRQREDLSTTIDAESSSLQLANNMVLYWPIDNF